MDINFWLYFIYFFIALFIAWYIPGFVLTHKIKFESRLASFVVSVMVGLVLWGWQGYIFGYLHLRFLSYIYLLIFLLIWLWKIKEYRKCLKFNLKEIDKIAFILIIIGIISQNLMTWGSGFKIPEGLPFYQINSFDGILQVAYIQQIIKSIPPIEPGLSGEILKNYHYWSNLIVAEIDRVFNIPVLNSFFQYSNVFLSLFLGLSSYCVMQAFGGTKKAARWFVFILMLGGDFGYLTMLLLGRGLNFNIPSFDNGAYFLQNPPRAYSVIILLSGLIVFFHWLKSKNYKEGIIVALLFSATIGFKVYSAIILFSGLGLLTLYFLIKKEWKTLFVFPLAILLALIIYLPNNSTAGGLIFNYLGWPLNFLTQGAVGLDEWELRRLTYLRENNWKRVWQMDLMIAGIFLFSQFGIKILGFFYAKKLYIQTGLSKIIFLFGGILTCLICGLFFIQKSGGFNVFNFIIAAGLFLSILTALFLSNLQERLPRSISILFTIFIVAIILPRVIYENITIIKLYLYHDSKLVNNEELASYTYLKQSTPENSLVLVHNPYHKDSGTPYVTMLSNRQTFLSGMNEMSAHDIDFKKRTELVDKIWQSKSILEVKNLLLYNKINYLYFPQSRDIPRTIILAKFPVVFKNKEATIFKIQ